MKKNLIFEKGQSLFEVVVAIAMSALIITAIVAIASYSIQGSSYSRDKNLASGFVEEAMEWLRQERDQNPNVFAANSIPGNVFCLDNLDWSTGTLCNGKLISDTNFERELFFSACSGCPSDVVEVKITVSWNDSKGLHEVSSLTNLAVK